MASPSWTKGDATTSLLKGGENLDDSLRMIDSDISFSEFLISSKILEIFFSILILNKYQDKKKDRVIRSFLYKLICLVPELLQFPKLQLTSYP